MGPPSSGDGQAGVPHLSLEALAAGAQVNAIRWARAQQCLWDDLATWMKRQASGIQPCAKGQFVPCEYAGSGGAVGEHDTSFRKWLPLQEL